MSNHNEYDDDRDRMPVFKVRSNNPNAIEGNYEWDDEPMDAAAALTVAAEALGPLLVAEILSRHWLHTNQGRALHLMAQKLESLANRRS